MTVQELIDALESLPKKYRAYTVAHLSNGAWTIDDIEQINHDGYEDTVVLE